MDIPRIDVLGVGISAINMNLAISELTRWVDEGEQHYVCVTGVHGVMESQGDHELLEIHNRSGLTTPDGMPMVWAGKRAGADQMSRVYGPDLMLEICKRSPARGWRHFFYGGQEGVPELLARRLQEQFEGLNVVGTHSPPFRPLTEAESDDIASMINEVSPDFVWVGLSTPKQERWMDANIGRLNAPALLGVGAAFDIHAGLLPQAPGWMQKRGLEWFYRLVREPRRLWKRYLGNNPRSFSKCFAARPASWPSGSWREANLPNPTTESEVH